MAAISTRLSTVHSMLKNGPLTAYEIAKKTPYALSSVQFYLETLRKNRRAVKVGTLWYAIPDDNFKASLLSLHVMLSGYMEDKYPSFPSSSGLDKIERALTRATKHLETYRAKLESDGQELYNNAITFRDEDD